MTIEKITDWWKDDANWRDWLSQQLKCNFDFYDIPWKQLIIVDFHEQKVLNGKCSMRLALREEDGVELSWLKTFQNAETTFFEIHFESKIQRFEQLDNGNFAWKTIADDGWHGSFNDWQDKDAWAKALDNFIFQAQLKLGEDFPGGCYRILNHNEEVMAEIEIINP